MSSSERAPLIEGLRRLERDVWSAGAHVETDPTELLQELLNRCTVGAPAYNAAPVRSAPSMTLTPAHAMATMPRRETVPARRRGVFHADAFRPIPPPPGARAIEIVDSSGERIAWAWIAAERFDAATMSAAWSYLDATDPEPVVRHGVPSLRVLK